MKYALLNLLLGATLGFYGIFFPALRIPLTWLGVSFAVLGVAYLLRRPALLGKRPDGTVSLWSLMALLPLHLLIHAVWNLSRLFVRENPADRICERLIAGRRLLPGEMPEDVELVVDLTSEFSEPREIRQDRDYRLFPMLDASVPEIEELRTFIASLPDVTIYVHCAQGHGRTGLFCIAFLIERGICRTPDEALEMIQAARPGVTLNSAQRTFIQRHYG